MKLNSIIVLMVAHGLALHATTQAQTQIFISKQRLIAGDSPISQYATDGSFEGDLLRQAKPAFGITSIGDTLIAGSGVGTDSKLQWIDSNSGEINLEVSIPGGTAAVESDSSNLVYTTSRADTLLSRVHRVSADGQVDLVIDATNVSFSGIDADRQGNIYVAGKRLTGPDIFLRKYDSLGGLVATVTISDYSFLQLNDLAVDEDRNLLYGNDQQGSVKVFDISSETPVFLESIELISDFVVGTSGISFSDELDHLFMTTWGKAGQFTRSGELVQEFDLNAQFPDFIGFDVVALSVPEPSFRCFITFSGLLLVLVGRRAS